MRRTQTFEIITDEPLLEEWEDLERRIAGTAMIYNRVEDEDVKATASKQLDGLKAEQEKLRPLVKAAARVITVEQLPAKAYARLVASHAPRPDDPFDQQMGFNTDTFDVPLMEHAIVCVTDGDGEPVEGFDWAEAADQIPFAQYQTIITGTLQLNFREDTVPFSLAD